MKNIGLLVLASFLPALAFAQSGGLDEFFYASGKIRVVIAVASIVLVGIFVYLFRLERKIDRIERKVDPTGKK